MIFVGGQGKAVTVHGFFKTPTFCLPNYRKPPIFNSEFENLANK